MDARLFRYLFENTSNSIVMTGCTWDKGVQEQIRYAYSCEMSRNNWRLNRGNEVKQILCGDSLNLFVMGIFSIEDAERLLYAIHHSKINTVIIPYVSPIQRFLILQSMTERGIEKPELREFIQSPYLYMQKTTVDKYYFVCGNGKALEKTDEELYPGYHFELQDEDVLKIIEELEGYRIPVVKAGHIVDNRMLFYFGHFGVDMRKIRNFVYNYAESGKIQEFGERQLKKMLLFYRKEFDDPRICTLTMFCSPTEIIATQTDCVLNTIVIDKEDFCHADIEGDEGRCTLKCMLYNDYDVCRCHRTEDAELRAGILFLGNLRLNRYISELRQRYHIVEDQIRAFTLPNCGDINSWHSDLAEQDVKKNVIYWICSMQPQTSDRVLREIKAKNARYRIIGLNEGYGCCFNGFLSEKTI